MQVANSWGAPLAFLIYTPPTVTIRSGIELTDRSVTERPAPKSQASPSAVDALTSLSRSTRLSKGQKNELARLVALVDAYAGGDVKLMREVCQLVQMAKTQSTYDGYRTTPYHSMEQVYEDWLKTLKGEPPSAGAVAEAIEAMKNSLEDTRPRESLVSILA